MDNARMAKVENLVQMIVECVFAWKTPTMVIVEGEELFKYGDMDDWDEVQKKIRTEINLQLRNKESSSIPCFDNIGDVIHAKDLAAKRVLELFYRGGRQNAKDVSGGIASAFDTAFSAITGYGFFYLYHPRYGDYLNNLNGTIVKLQKTLTEG